MPKKLAFILFFVNTCLIASAVFLHALHTKRMQSDLNWIDSVLTAKQALMDIITALDDASASQCSYLLCDDKDYLNLYQNNMDEIPGLLNVLQESMMQISSDTFAKTQRLCELIETRIAELHHSLEMGMNG